MIVNKPAINFQDNRGNIIDIIANETIDSVTLITFAKGATRANHYHKETIQWNYVIEGVIKLVTQEAGSISTQEAILKKGDLAYTIAYEKHALQAIEDSVLMVFTRGPRSGEHYESDTFRLEEPLIKL